MEKIKQDINKSLEEIEKIGLGNGNIEMAAKLIEMKKNIAKIEEGDKMRGMRNYSNYRGDDRESDREYWITSYRDSGYGRRGVPGSGRGLYRTGDMDRFDERLDRIMDGADEYRYGKDRYREGGNEERMNDGLEKMMYAICTFVESAMDFAETPQEKEIIRKHIQKL